MEQNRSCLILDDQVSMKEAIQYLANQCELRILWACSVTEAILILEQEDIGLALVDVHLRGNDDSHQFVREFLISRNIAYFRWSAGDLKKIPCDVRGLLPGPFDKAARTSGIILALKQALAQTQVQEKTTHGSDTEV